MIKIRILGKNKMLESIRFVGAKKSEFYSGWLCLLVCLASSLVRAEGASFDCNKATTSIERMICSDQELSDLDKTLGGIYSTDLKSKAYLNMEQVQRAWLKERNQCGDVTCLKTKYQERIAALKPSKEPPKYDLPPLDGVRHGATKDVFDKLVKDFKARPYQVAKRSDGVLADFTGGHCMDMLNALRNGSATYVEPKFVTDNYDDPRLDPYKKKYHDVIAKKTWGNIPWADWLGARIIEATGVVSHPTRTFTIYEMDLDSDKKDEVIFYGEMHLSAQDSSGGLINYGPGASSSYTIFKSNMRMVDFVGGPDPIYDYAKKKHEEDYSIIFQYNDNKYIAISYLGNDFVKTEIERLGLTKGTDGRRLYAEITCDFNLGNNK